LNSAALFKLMATFETLSPAFGFVFTSIIQIPPLVLPVLPPLAPLRMPL
jgi:hypothetical protein